MREAVVQKLKDLGLHIKASLRFLRGSAVFRIIKIQNDKKGGHEVRPYGVRWSIYPP
jgi:hypothetical protein